MLRHEDGFTGSQRDPVARAFEVIGWMVDSDESSWRLRDIAHGVGMHPSTLHRLLAKLVSNGLISQDEDTGGYRLGLELVRLAVRTVAKEPMVDIAQPVLRELASLFGESTMLVAYQPLRQAMMPLTMIESSHLVRSVLRLGDYGPITVGSTGLAILAWLPEAEREDILSRPVEPFSENTPTEPSELRDMVRTARDLGYAATVNHRNQGTAGVSAPIFGPDGKVCGAITVVFPMQRYDAEREREYGSVVKESSDRISSLLRGHG